MHLLLPFVTTRLSAVNTSYPFYARYIKPVLAASVGVFLVARAVLVPLRTVASVVRGSPSNELCVLPAPKDVDQ